MKILLTFLLTAALGWLGMNLMNPPTADVESESPASPSSLLGERGSAAEPMPDMSAQQSFDETAEFVRAVDAASFDTLKAWVLEAMKDPDGRASSTRMARLFEKLAALDPERALQFASEHPELERFRGTALGVWARRDMKRAVDKALEIDPQGQQLYGVMMAISGDQALELHDLLVARGLDKQGSGYFGNLFHRLYDSGPEKAATLALEHSLKLKNPRWDSHGLENVLRRWAKEDPEATFRWLDDMESPASKNLALKALSAAWAESDPVGCLENLWGRLDKEQKGHLISNLGNGSGTNLDPEAFLSWMDENVESPAMTQRLLVGMVEGLRNSEHPEMMATLVPHLTGSERGVKNGVRQAAQKWASLDSEAAQAWIETVEDPQLRSAALVGVAHGLTETDPMKALELLTSEDNGLSEKDGLSRHSIGRLLEALGNEGVAPKDFLEQVPENLRGEATMSYAVKFAKNSASEIVGFLSQQPESAGRDGALEYSVGYWATQEPDKAAAWVDGLPESKHRGFAARNLVNTWARHDLDAAAEWLEAQSPGESRDAAALELAKIQVDRQPEAAFQMAQALDQGHERDRVLKESLQAWARVDPDKARAALSQSTLPDKERAAAEKSLTEAEALANFFKAQP